MPRFLIGRKVPMPPFRWIEQLSQVVSVRVSVVKRILARVPPGGNGSRVRGRHWPDPESRHHHIAHNKRPGWDSSHTAEGRHPLAGATRPASLPHRRPGNPH
jgi:hypothetical protein